MRNVGLIVAVLVSLPAFGDDGKIETDRPMVTNSPHTVGFGHMQVESGFEIDRTIDTKELEEELSTPLLVRIGIAKHLEARIETRGLGLTRTTQLEEAGFPTTGNALAPAIAARRWSTWPIQVNQGSGPSLRIPMTRTRLSLPGGVKHEPGVYPVEVGGKWTLFRGDDEPSIVPDVGVIGQLSIPGGMGPYYDAMFNPTGEVMLQWNLPWDIQVSTMTGLLLRASELPEGPRGIMTVELNKKWFDRLGTSIELAGEELRLNRRNDDIISAGLGATYLVTDRVQIDGVVRSGVFEGKQYTAQSFGLSVKM